MMKYYLTAAKTSTTTVYNSYEVHSAILVLVVAQAGGVLGGVDSLPAVAGLEVSLDAVVVLFTGNESQPAGPICFLASRAPATGHGVDGIEVGVVVVVSSRVIVVRWCRGGCGGSIVWCGITC